MELETIAEKLNMTLEDLTILTLDESIPFKKDFNEYDLEEVRASVIAHYQKRIDGCCAGIVKQPEKESYNNNYCSVKLIS